MEEQTTAREQAVDTATALVAIDANLRKAGHSLPELLIVAAKNTWGVDVRPTTEDLEAVAALSGVETSDAEQADA